MKVTYLGQEFKVPKWAKYIAADTDGHVFAFDYVPQYTQPSNLWFATNFTGGRCMHVGALNNKHPIQEIK